MRVRNYSQLIDGANIALYQTHTKEVQKVNFRLMSLTNLELKVFTLTHTNQPNEFNNE